MDCPKTTIFALAALPSGEVTSCVFAEDLRSILLPIFERVTGRTFVVPEVGMKIILLLPLNVDVFAFKLLPAV